MNFNQYVQIRHDTTLTIKFSVKDGSIKIGNVGIHLKEDY